MSNYLWQPLEIFPNLCMKSPWGCSGASPSTVPSITHRSGLTCTNRITPCAWPDSIATAAPRWPPPATESHRKGLYSTCTYQGRIQTMQSMHMHLSKYPEPVYSSVRHWDQTTDDVSVSNSRSPKVTFVINSIKVITLAHISGSSLNTYTNNVQPSVAISQHPP